MEFIIKLLGGFTQKDVNELKLKKEKEFLKIIDELETKLLKFDTKVNILQEKLIVYKHEIERQKKSRTSEFNRAQKFYTIIQKSLELINEIPTSSSKITVNHIKKIQSVLNPKNKEEK